MHLVKITGLGLLAVIYIIAENRFLGLSINTKYY